VVATVRERLAVNKQRLQILHNERFSLKKLNEVEGKEKYRVEVSNRFAALKELDAEVEINTAWEMIERISKCHPERVCVRFEVFMVVTTKNDILLDVTPCGSCKN
jgi:hypothetical protein